MDRRQVLLALILDEIKLPYHGGRQIKQHSALFLLKRAGIEIGYTFQWTKDGLWARDLARDLTAIKNLNSVELEEIRDSDLLIENDWILDPQIQVKLGILRNRYSLDSSSEEELRANAAYLFQQLFTINPRLPFEPRA